MSLGGECVLGESARTKTAAVRLYDSKEEPMKKLLTIMCLALLPMLVAGKQKARVADVSLSWLRVENLEVPLSIDTDTPRFSWMIQSDKQNVRQTAHQIIVSTDQGEVWNSGKVESDQQLWVRYGGQPLKSATQCSWKVKVWTTAGESEWSEEECFGIGLLKESNDALSKRPGTL